MEVAVTARNCEISERYRLHVAEKLERLEKFDHRIIRVHVEVCAELNPRQSQQALHVELTVYSRGPVLRAEGRAEDKMSALDIALDKLEEQMRRAADRRRVHHGRHAPISVAEATSRIVMI